MIDKEGILDPTRMTPRLNTRPDDAPSLMAEMGIDAIHKALAQAGRDPVDIDLILCAASNHERAYPAIAVEMQQLLGASGFAYDMNVACSSATFGLQTAADMVRTGSVKCAVVVSPEVCSAHLEWRDRDCHFIFGDVATAILIEPEADGMAGFRVLSTRCATKFSNNIRNNDGYLRRAHDQMEDRRDMQFMQEGRKVFKEVLPMVARHITGHLHDESLDANDLKRLWLHQANKTMNDYIGKKKSWAANRPKASNPIFYKTAQIRRPPAPSSHSPSFRKTLRRAISVFFARSAQGIPSALPSWSGSDPFRSAHVTFR